MPINIKIFVIDAAPLINLAVAKSLDYLFYSGLPVLIPDAVFYEATAIAGKLGAQEIIEWQRANDDKIIIETTNIFQNEILILEAMKGNNAYRKSKDLGERAAIEVIEDRKILNDNEFAIFLTDDAGVKRFIKEPEKTILITTSDYLKQLEKVGKIQSYDYIVSQITKSGRTIPEQDLFSRHDESVRDAVKQILKIKT